MRKLIIILLLFSVTIGAQTKTDSLLNSIEMSRVKKGYFKLQHKDSILEPNFTLESKAETYAYIYSFLNNGEVVNVIPAITEIRASMDLGLINNTGAILLEDWEYNTKQTALTDTEINAKEILGKTDFKTVFISTKGKKEFPKVVGSKFNEYSLFETNQIYLLSILTLDGEINHYYTLWKL